MSLSRVAAFTGLIFALIGAVEAGTGHSVDPRWLGYGALAITVA